MKKRVIATMLTMTMLSSLLAGCGSTEKATSESKESVVKESSEASDIEVEDSEDVSEEWEPSTISIIFNDSATSPASPDWKIFEWINEATNVTFDYIPVPSSDYAAKVELTFNSGNIPDIVTGTDPTGTYVAAGILLPVSDYVDQMPNYQAFLEDFGYVDYMESTKFADGKYYGFPSKIKDMNMKTQQWLIRTDIFEENDIPVPTTMDEVYEAGLKLKELYPDSTPITNRFGTGNLMAGIGAGFGVSAGWASNGMDYDFETGEWVYSSTTDNYKEMLEYTKKLYDAGVLDKEFTTLDSNLYESRIVTGETFIMYDWSGNCEKYNLIGTETDDNFNVGMIYPPTGPYGDTALSSNRPNEGFALLPATLAKDEEHLAEVLKYIDWSYTEEAAKIVTFGIEGETYEVDENGSLKYLTDWSNTAQNYGVDSSAFVYWQHGDALLGMLSEADQEMHKKIGADGIIPLPNPQVPLSADELEELQVKIGVLTDLQGASMEQFILGERSFDDWDAYVAECESKGSLDLVEAYNK